MVGNKQKTISNRDRSIKMKPALKKASSGKLDIDSKLFMLDKRRFADAFNYFMYGGEQVINPENLKAMDTTAIALPYGDNAREPIQKFRDVLKKWTVNRDGNAIYAILGIENQSEINYAMAVRNMLYDAIGYDEQVHNAKKSYKNRKGLNHAEFVSGFKKSDKLIPIITLVVYFGANEWDAPRSIKEMLDTTDGRILQFVQDYKINLIEPYKLSSEDLDSFHTDLGLALKFIKYSRDKQALDKVISQDDRYKSLERDAFYLMNDITKSNIKPIIKGDKVDMCAAIEAMRMESRQEGLIEGEQRGIAIGTEQTKREIYERLIASKNMSPQEAAAMTGLGI